MLWVVLGNGGTRYCYYFHVHFAKWMTSFSSKDDSLLCGTINTRDVFLSRLQRNHVTHNKICRYVIHNDGSCV